MAKIHPTAIVDPAAQIHEDVSIGPYSIIGSGVIIGPDCEIGPHVVIEKDTDIGSNNRIGASCTIGMDPQSIKYRGEKTRLRIGNGNVFREYVNMSRGSREGSGETIIGDGNFIMSFSHVAHDCNVGNNTIFANAATLAGHVVIGDHAVIGGLAAIHQFARVGAHAMLGGGAMVAQDIPPYVTASGNRAVPHGINTIGLSRRGFSNEQISAIKKAFKIVFLQNLPLKEAISRIDSELLPGCPELKIFSEFLATSSRGVAR